MRGGEAMEDIRRDLRHKLRSFHAQIYIFEHHGLHGSVFERLDKVNREHHRHYFDYNRVVKLRPICRLRFFLFLCIFCCNSRNPLAPRKKTYFL